MNTFFSTFVFELSLFNETPSEGFNDEAGICVYVLYNIYIYVCAQSITLMNLHAMPIQPSLIRI